MAEFTGSDLLTYAKARYLQQVLRDRIAGAAGDNTLADLELLKIAESVVGRVRSAAQISVGWPVVVTANVLQHALELFNWRTLQGREAIAADQRKIGEAAEKFFDDLGQGAEAWGVESAADVGTPPAPVAARARDGSALIGTISDRPNLFEELSGPGWNWI
jgi:hypothetical protein